jgi:hypothetical protein
VDKSDKIIEKWHICFRRSEYKHWVMRWLDPHFQHCYAVKESPGGEFWMIVNSTAAHMDVQLKSKIDYPHIRLLAPECVILTIQAIIRPDNNRHPFCIFNCVEVCKAVLGINDFWCWTPYQLYKRLKDGR